VVGLASALKYIGQSEQDLILSPLARASGSAIGSTLMSNQIRICAAIFLQFACVAAVAADQKDMIGRWRWQQFTIEVTKCQSDSICAKIIEGPKNVGMEVFANKLQAKDGNLFGQIVHPETKEIYNTRFQQGGPDRWHLDGCTQTRVCLSGDFLRVK
jgi:hypothetical protein